METLKQLLEKLSIDYLIQASRWINVWADVSVLYVYRYTASDAWYEFMFYSFHFLYNFYHSIGLW